ncbi:probable alpha,alpha-trehalose-phosphate synthase [UDP-forming] 7 [Dendrobium catenatum]|uniref:probable alpha,alpha-trehalose-phosphate synthase [UDP-forming] 7 n=1 Tax=Dendrobium catenatum TaxID=906689 RepID=UPI0009F2EB4C|nr:probable alpha,alpha-trehalose-phosphate synthase [UDP-forming] 7 [Dendrobium catenatum]
MYCRRSAVDDDRSRKTRLAVDDDRRQGRWAVNDARSRISFYQAQSKKSLDQVDRNLDRIRETLRAIRRMRMSSATIPRHSSSSLSSSAPRKRHQSRHDYPPLELPLRWRDPLPVYPPVRAVCNQPEGIFNASHHLEPVERVSDRRSISEHNVIVPTEKGKPSDCDMETHEETAAMVDSASAHLIGTCIELPSSVPLHSEMRDLTLTAANPIPFDQSLPVQPVQLNFALVPTVRADIQPDANSSSNAEFLGGSNGAVATQLIPTFLRSRFNRLRMGFFLHSPFPSSEIYHTFPVREEILKALLNCDLDGFHTFDYAHHFLSCCSRILGIEYQSKRGYIGLEYFGRIVGIKIMPVGIHMGQLQSALALPDKDWRISKLQSALALPDKDWRISQLQHQLAGKMVLLGVDDMDIFKGINLKLLAFEQMLKIHTKWQGNAVLVQIFNLARGRGRDLEEIQLEIQQSCRRINQQFGNANYKHIIFIDRPVSIEEGIAYYTIADCVVVTAVRDGMNLTPYEYIVSRQGIASGSDSDSGSDGPKKNMLLVSEFIGCSPSLSGAIRINPWNTESTAEDMNEAISMNDVEKQVHHEKHYSYVSTHDAAYWSKSFMHDSERTCKDHFKKRCWEIGLRFGFRVVALDPNFRKLNINGIVSAYQRSKSRAILLNYDGTVIPQAAINKTPSAEVISILNTLCGDKKNLVFIVSGRGKDSLGKWFSPCKNLEIAAEHGYYMRWSQDEEWETCVPMPDFDWKQNAEPVMQLYTETTNGSSIEAKESALVWNYQYAYTDFGSRLAKELLDHLESIIVLKVYGASGLMGMHKRRKVFDPGIWLGCSPLLPS